MQKYETHKKILYIHLIAIAFYGFIIILTKRTPNEILNVFDSFHYRYIAENGYEYELHTAFFPVIPILIRILGVYGVIVLNQIFHFSSLILLYKIFTCDESKKWLIILLYALSPMTAYSILPYTESLFMFLTLLTFYMFTKRKINLYLGIILGLCVATRNTGSMLFFAIFIACCYLWYKHEIKFKQIVLTYAPATIISCIYPAYLQIKFGNWKIFMDCQMTYWNRIKSNIFDIIKCQLTVILNPNKYYNECISEIKILFQLNEIITIIMGISIIILGVISLMESSKQTKINKANNIVCFLFMLLCMFCFTLTIRNPQTLPHAPTASFYRYYLGLYPIWLACQTINEKILKTMIMIIIPISFIICYMFFKEIFFY